MKQILLAVILAFTTSLMVNAQKQTITKSDSTGNAKVTVTKKKDNRTHAANTAVTVIGVDTAAADSTEVAEEYVVSSTGNGRHSALSLLDDDDFSFKPEKVIGEGILLSIIAIVAVFGLPVFILFVIFFFRYKNRKARYHLVEQALAAGQPLPENFLRENQPIDRGSQGIKNTFTGIGLFVFLWAITGNFGIGTIGLLVMFTGIGQWVIGYKQNKNKDKNIHEEKTDLYQ